jgi:dihydroneopterin aldolase
MTLFLASVRDAAEARLAQAGGADIIDFKNPADGPLGALSPEEAAAIRAALGPGAVTSAVLGNLPTTPHALLPAAERMAASGVDYLKFGIFPGYDAQAAIAALAPLARRVRMIGVFFADAEPDFSLLGTLAEFGHAGALLDTLDKGKGGLLTHLDIAQLAAFTAECRRLGLKAGLAGGLEPPDIPRLLLLAPDLLGFRSALCAAERAGALDPARIALIRGLIPRPGEAAAEAALDVLAGRGYVPDETDPEHTERVFVEDLVVPMSIGVYRAEEGRRQKVRFAVEVAVRRPPRPPADLRDVFSYDVIRDTIRMLAAEGHVGLVETLAERLAARLFRHPRVLKVKVRIEKLEAGDGVVGVAIERRRPQNHAPLYALGRGEGLSPEEDQGESAMGGRES